MNINPHYITVALAENTDELECWLSEVSYDLGYFWTPHIVAQGISGRIQIGPSSFFYYNGTVSKELCYDIITHARRASRERIEPNAISDEGCERARGAGVPQ